MFDPKQITASMLGYAPQFVLTRFSSVIMGVIAAYGVLLFFLGQPPFFQRVGQLSLMMTVCYWAARATRYAIVRVVHLIEGTTPESAAGAESAGASADGATASPVSLGLPASPTSQAAAAQRDFKGLD